MNPDGTSDLNLRVFTAPEWSGKTYSDPNDVHGEGYTAAIKCTTRVRGFTANFGGTVYCGSENAADVNDGSSVRLVANKWVISGSKYGFTCKGASYLDLEGEIEGSGKECDIDLGGYSDQRQGDSSGRLNVWRADRTTPVRVRCIQAETPYLASGSGPYVFLFPRPDAWYHGIAAWIFRFLRRNRLAFT